MNTPRLRLLSSIDFTKAKNHRKCNGTGICGYKKIDNPENPGESIVVPIVCNCVTKNGGVRRDAFDNMATELQKQIESGTFGETLARDVFALPEKSRNIKIYELRNAVENQDTDENVKMHIREALKILEAKCQVFQKTNL